MNKVLLVEELKQMVEDLGDRRKGLEALSGVLSGVARRIDSDIRARRAEAGYEGDTDSFDSEEESLGELESGEDSLGTALDSIDEASTYLRDYISTIEETLDPDEGG